MVEIEKINKFGNRRGIYMFKNMLNGKIYIGEALNFRKRMLAYVSRLNRKSKEQRILSAFAKHGLRNFKFFILEEYPTSTGKDVLLDREEFWINFYQATNPNLGYNVTGRGVKMSDSFCERVRAGVKRGVEHHMYGKHMDLGTKAKLSKSLSGRVRSDGHRKNLSISNTGKKWAEGTYEKYRQTRLGVPNLANSRKIEQINIESGEVIKIWQSAAEAARKLVNPKNGKKLRQSSISLCIGKSKKKIYGGYKWRWHD